MPAPGVPILSFAKTVSGSPTRSSGRFETLETGMQPVVSSSSGCRPCPVGRVLGGHGGRARKEERNGGRGPVAGSLAGVGLCCPSAVAVMQATDFGDRDYRSELRRVDRRSFRCVLVEREVSAGPVIVRKVRE
jgi:hypothetical protein